MLALQVMVRGTVEPKNKDSECLPYRRRDRSFPTLKYRHRYGIVEIAKYRHLWKARAKAPWVRAKGN